MLWIENLKVGDAVIDGDQVLTVTAVHKLHIVCGGSKYRKMSGARVGSSAWSRSYIREATPEAIEALKTKKEHRALLFYVTQNDYRKTSIEALRQIVAILKADKPHNG